MMLTRAQILPSLPGPVFYLAKGSLSHAGRVSLFLSWAAQLHPSNTVVMHLKMDSRPALVFPSESLLPVWTYAYLATLRPAQVAVNDPRIFGT